jgi:hypothetical protein
VSSVRDVSVFVRSCVLLGQAVPTFTDSTSELDLTVGAFRQPGSREFRDLLYRNLRIALRYGRAVIQCRPSRSDGSGLRTPVNPASASLNAGYGLLKDILVDTSPFHYS